MDEIKIFNSPQFGDIRTAGTSEQPLFCLADVCKSIGIVNARNVKERLDGDGVHQADIIDTLGRTQKVSYVTESGLYSLIFASKLPTAKAFKECI